MKTIATALLMAVASCHPVAAEDGYSGDEAYAKAGGAFSAATGAMILGTIDAIGDRPQVGFGAGNIGGHSGVGVKITTPLGRDVHGSVGAFRIEDGSSGFALSFSYSF